MRYLFAFVTCVIFFIKPSFSQADTTYLYLFEGKTTTKDSATSLVEFTKQNGVWHGVEYFMKTNTIKSEGDYLSNDVTTANGSFKNYSEKGVLFSQVDYVAGKATQKTVYYPNGSKHAWAVHKDGEEKDSKGWDENGKEIKGFIFERAAQFKGGVQGWVRYLERHLNANAPADVGAPVGTYTIKVEFIVNTEGMVSNVRALNIPLKCQPCAAEAVRVLKDSPAWEPAVQYNENVIYQARQAISFVVDDEPAKRKNE